MRSLTPSRDKATMAGWCWQRVKRGTVLALIGVAPLALDATAAVAGDPAQGARLYRACAACHSLEPGRHRTGPSLATIVGRKAGTLEGFRRYSPALKAAGITWDEATLDAWIADPQAVIPGNRMSFEGLRDAQARSDLIAFLKQPEPQATGGGGMMSAGEAPDLKTLGPEHLVTAVRRCEDTYEVTTADGSTEPYWEFNLRFKTDGSEVGPEPGKPRIVGAGMAGDRASIVFAAPGEISPFIANGCP